MKREEQLFSKDNRSSSDPGNRQDDDTSFFVDNYGGLNVTSPSVNLPYTDSPELFNCKIGLSGTVSKRSGSFIRKSFTGEPNGTILTTYKLNTDDIILVMKLGKDLYLYLLPDETDLSSATLIKKFSNVWSTAAEKQKPSFVWTGEEKSRLIMATPSNCPIELEILQLKVTGAGTTDISVKGDLTGTWASTNTFCVYGTTSVAASTVSYSSPSTVFSFASVIPTGQISCIIEIGWHWWAEALKRTSEQVYASTYRFNTSINADANVQIPVELRRGLEADALSMSSLLAYGVKPLLVYKNNTSSPTSFTYDNTPDDKDDYAFSSQVYTTGAGADYITPGTAYLTFGGIDGSGTYPPTPIHLVRQIYLPFNGGNKTVCTDIQVYNSSGLKLQANYSATRNAQSATNQYYWLHDDSFNVETTNTDKVQILSFAGGYPFGVGEAFVEIINAGISTNVVGTAAVATYYTPKTEGTYRPWYGASLYCNYATGVFPSVVGLYQDRLVFTGFLSAPLALLCSNSKDNGSRYFYQNFQVDFEDTTLAYNPVEIVLDSIGEDVITNVVPWYNSCFVLTQKTTRRIHGGDSVAISPTNAFQNTVSSVGCLSRHGVTRTDSNLLFISSSGLYSVDLTNTTGDFSTTNVGLKVQKYFQGNERYGSMSWITYNQFDDEVWVGLTSGDDPYVADIVLVLFNQRNAWSRYGFSSGKLSTVAATSSDKRTILSVINRDTDITVIPSTSSEILITEFNIDSVLTDLTYNETLANIVAGSTTHSFHTRLRFTINSNQRTVSTQPKYCPTNYTNNGFFVLPLADNDEYLYVRKYNGYFWETLTISNGDFSILPQQSALRFNIISWHDGEILEIKLIDDGDDFPIRVFRDEFELELDTNYTVSEDGQYLKVTLVGSGDADSVFLIGSTIPCWHFTPTFTRQFSPRLKRAIHYVGYYDNRDYTELYQESDVNTSAGQDETELLDSYKVNVSLKLGVLYNDARSGVYESEVYGAEQLLWDASLFDFPRDSVRNQFNDIVRTSVPVIGLGYSFQCVNYNFSPKRFELIGYHVLTAKKGVNATRWY